MEENTREESQSSAERSEEYIDSLREDLLKLADDASMDDLKRIELLLSITSELYKSRTEMREAQIALANYRLEAWKEGSRLHFETYKSLTVLDSGALVAFAVATHNLFSAPGSMWILGLAYTFVLYSLIASIGMMFVVGNRMFPDRDSRDVAKVIQSGRSALLGVMDVTTWSGFALGLGAFALFLSRNL